VLSGTYQIVSLQGYFSTSILLFVEAQLYVGKKEKSRLGVVWLIAAGAYPGFCSMS